MQGEEGEREGGRTTDRERSRTTDRQRGTETEPGGMGRHSLRQTDEMR